MVGDKVSDMVDKVVGMVICVCFMAWAPKGRKRRIQLEVGDRRAPRLLVFNKLNQEEEECFYHKYLQSGKCDLNFVPLRGKHILSSSQLQIKQQNGILFFISYLTLSVFFCCVVANFVGLVRSSSLSQAPWDEWFEISFEWQTSCSKQCYCISYQRKQGNKTVENKLSSKRGI